jgi:hypothetical protein
VNAIKILAVVLIIAGVLGLLYGKFSYTKETHNAKLGPLELAVKDKETVHVPTWLSLAAVAGGVVLLLVGKKR